MDGYFFVVVSTYKPVHGECSRVAVGSDGLWLSDHTSNSCTLYTRGTNLGGDHGPATLQLVLLFLPPTGIMLGGGEGWGERRTCHGWRHLNKPYYKAFVSNYFNNF